MRTQATFRASSASSAQLLSTATRYGAVRWAKAVASGSTFAIAPPICITSTIASGVGRSSASCVSVSIASSVSASRYCDFQNERWPPRGKRPSKPDCTPVNGAGPERSARTVPSSRSGLVCFEPLDRVRAAVDGADDRDRAIVQLRRHVRVGGEGQRDHERGDLVRCACSA